MDRLPAVTAIRGFRAHAAQRAGAGRVAAPGADAPRAAARTAAARRAAAQRAAAPRADARRAAAPGAPFIAPGATLALAVLLAGLLGTACSREGGSAPPPSRFDAVRSTAPAGDTPERWCDAAFAANAGPLLTLPRHAPARPGATAPGSPGGRWTWVNVWATWCAPCRREMPLLLSWRDQLRKSGRDVDFWFVSIDADQGDLSAFLQGHPEIAPGVSVRLVSNKEFEPWLHRYQPDAGGAIPVQVIAGPDGRVRCVRGGSLGDGDFPTIDAMLR
jgi:thiol-disulfide isomerase/thioredoxin